MYSVLGAIFGGWRTGRRGWVIGGVGLAVAWAAIVLGDYFMAPSQVTEMARVVGSLLGDLPGPFTFIITILIGGLLGVAGGAVGSSLVAFSDNNQ